LQGEGQEFESPRLHHLRAARHDLEERSPDPCPSQMGEATDQRTAGGREARGPPISGGTHLTNWNSDRQKEKSRSSISPCCQKNSDIPIPSVRDRWVRTLRGSSYTGHEVDALAPRADEGRGRLRKAPGSREQTSIRRCPNGETRLEKSSSPLAESNRPGGGKPAN
jgi:hypothetical protein